jgi:tRNA-splicing endonuclease subunit Sen54
MADADEDAVRGTTVEATQIETDLSDETQDFRLLNHLNLYVRIEAGKLRNASSSFATTPLAYACSID